ncbi:HXXEE domain-containing protein [Clostridium sp. BJN0001]|uniref:HXXEE domain-containing protein n=1 Tax=Clostridium sp. BJN0001 TaxID=2930219 RepID=UPI001FD0BF3B|nr:HXXEE domain-containing protein [Clostridium sp. BJN0001]
MAKNWCKKGLKQHINLHMTPFGNAKSTEVVAIAVYEELILWIVATMVGVFSGFYGLWYGFLISNIVHLILLHIILLPLAYHLYVPGQITAWITVIPCFYILKLAQNVLQYSISEIIIWTILGVTIGFLNMKILHKSINKFDASR